MVEILDRQRSRRVSRPALERFLRAVERDLQRVHDDDELTVCLVSDHRMRALNRRFRDLDRPTDVLSFPAAAEGDPNPEPGAPCFLGDIVIAVPTAARQARERGHSLARELKILALHGYLHLLGHDHESDDGTMDRLQKRLVRRLLPRGSRRGRR